MPRRFERVPRWGRLSLRWLPLFAVSIMWARSYVVADYALWRREDGARLFQCTRGAIVLGADLADWSGQPASMYGLFYERTAPVPPQSSTPLALNVDVGDTYQEGSRVGIGWFRWAARGGGSSISRLIVPMWLLAFVTAAPPAGRSTLGRFRRARGRRRSRGGLCAACGYDLRGGLHGRCPECGSAADVPDEPAAAAIRDGREASAG